MDPNKMFGYVVASGAAKVLDLRPQSQTYGQILPATAVNLGTFSASELASTPMAVAAILAGTGFQPPTPNVEMVDTAKMFSDPAHALIAQVTVNGGFSAASVCAGFFSTTPPKYRTAGDRR